MNTSEDKRKHLEFIQQVIGRMNHNSFLLKAWTITLNSGFIIACTRAETHDILYAYIPFILSLWSLDGYFLAQERKYRALYDEAARKRRTDYAMRAGKVNTREWLSSSFSQTLRLFYPLQCLAFIVVYFFYS